MLNALRKTRIAMQALALSLVLVFPAISQAETVAEQPSMLAMTGDLVLVRPIMLAVTAVGAGVFVASLPFSALGGNVQQAADMLVVGPARTTFVRCLGCSRPAVYHEKQ